MRVEPLLTGRLGRPYLWRATCASTQALLDDPALPEGAVAVAEAQTQGRGRLGRTWEAPAGAALLCSVLLRPPAGRRLGELSLVGGLATARAVDHVARVRSGIKWPNDVLLDGAKVAGVLAEGRNGAVVLGIGVNVGQAAADLPADARTRPGSLLTATGLEHDRASVLARLLVELEAGYETWLADGLEPLVPELAARDVLLGVEVQLGDAVGRAAGIAPDGRLILLVGSETRLVESGEVSVRAPAAPA
ncbi:MAG: biotin--[acetyl-CoA-carboxylase] ligase [Thermoleophilia bacterium]